VSARIVLPALRRKGETMELKILIQHPMDTGFVHDLSGAVIEKNVIHTLRLNFNGELLMQAELGTGTAANPFLQFPVRVFEDGEFVLNWIDDRGVQGEERIRCQLN
jgi:sulfur-oxidizing protein SoxZ